MPPETRHTTAQGSNKLYWHGFKGRARERIKTEPLLEIIGPDPVRDLSGAERMEFVKAKHDKGSRVYRAFLDIGAGEEELFIKTFNAAETFKVMAGRMVGKKGLKRPLHYPVKLVKLIWAPSPARRSWVAAGACEKARIPVAEPLLYLSRRAGPLREEVLVSRGVNPRTSPNARLFFESEMKPPLGRQKRALKLSLIKELGALLKRVYESDIMFPDFKLHNLVISEDAADRPCLVVVDLAEAVVNRPGYPEFTFLERFSVRLPGFTNTDKIRLVKAYLEAGNDDRSWPEICKGVRERAVQQGR